MYVEEYVLVMHVPQHKHTLLLSDINLSANVMKDVFQNIKIILINSFSIVFYFFLSFHTLIYFFLPFIITRTHPSPHTRMQRYLSQSSLSLSCLYRNQAKKYLDLHFTTQLKGFYKYVRSRTF